MASLYENTARSLNLANVVSKLRTKEYSSSRTHVICVKPCHILHSRALSRAL